LARERSISLFAEDGRVIVTRKPIGGSISPGMGLHELWRRYRGFHKSAQFRQNFLTYLLFSLLIQFFNPIAGIS
jgi:hypothetical protein